MQDINAIISLINGIYYDYNGSRNDLLMNLDLIAKTIIYNYNIEGLDFKTEEELNTARVLYKELSKIKSFLKDDSLRVYNALERKVCDSDAKWI